MRKARDRRHAAVDLEHMRRLHQEALEQLELMCTALEAAEQAAGTMRDVLDDMVLDHWNRYQDALHMIAMHDNALTAVLSKHGMNTREDDTADITVQESFANQPLLQLLLLALIRRHRRFFDVYSWRGNPMSDYLKESMAMEREHIADLITMIQELL